MMLSPNETYISFDIETDGQIPGISSMLQLGAVAYDHTGKEISSFCVNLHKLLQGVPDPATMEWWSTRQEAYEATRTDLVLPAEAIGRFDLWVKGLPGKAVLMANPGNWDGMFVTWYAFVFLKRFLCTKHRVLDIRSFTMAALETGFMDAGRKDLRKIFKRITAQNTNPHNALHDAREQGDQFFAVVALREKKGQGESTMDNQIEVGDRVAHVITGLAGVVTGIVTYATGTCQARIQPEALTTEGKMHEGVWIEAPELIIVNKQVLKAPTYPTPKFLYGEYVQEATSGLTGIVHGIGRWLHGCLRYTIMGDSIVPHTGEPVCSTFDEMYLQSVDDSEHKAVKQPARRSGGPERPQTSI